MTTAEQDEQFYRDTESIAFPKLSDEQLALLEPLGQRRTLRRGDFVLKAGQRDFPLTITLEGAIEVFETRDGVEQVLATSQPRDFLGDVSMLIGTSALGSARVKSETAEVVQVPADRLRRSLAGLPPAGGPVGDARVMAPARGEAGREVGRP